ncbi:MAG TPA: hypothetical protein VN420_00945 [Candidatus Fimivivens sp.]|nr:hypothetical protein [Candidatus Fimivivens sp.]
MENKQNSKEKVEDILAASGLSDDDRALWAGRLSEADPSMRGAFVESFEDDYDLLRFFTGDLRRRIEAGNDRQKLDEVLTAEKSFFAERLKQSLSE